MHRDGRGGSFPLVPHLVTGRVNSSRMCVGRISPRARLASCPASCGRQWLDAVDRGFLRLYTSSRRVSRVTVKVVVPVKCDSQSRSLHYTLTLFPSSLHVFISDAIATASGRNGYDDTMIAALVGDIF